MYFPLHVSTCDLNFGLLVSGNCETAMFIEVRILTHYLSSVTQLTEAATGGVM